MQPLLPVGQLISSGWDRFLADGRRNLELSVRFLLSSVIVFAAAFLSRDLPPMGQLATSLLAIVVASIINIHTMVTLVDFVLRRDADPSKATVPSVEIGKRLFWPFAVVAFFQTLAVLGGLALFIIPGIWLSVLFSYSVFCLVEDNRRGFDALATSADLIRPHWWGVFGRSLAVGVVVGLFSAATTLLILLIVGMFVGMDKVFEFANTVAIPTAVDPMADAIQSLINGIVSALFIPLAVIYQAKIFHSLKKSR